MKLFVGVLLACLVIDQCLADGDHLGRQGRRLRNRGGRRLRTRGRVGGRRPQAVPASAIALGPPPQPEIRLPVVNSAPALPLVRQRTVAALPAAPPAPIAPLPVAPAHPFKQNPRGGRQFDIGSDSATVQGSTPDNSGNYNFQFATDDGVFRQETGNQKSLGGAEQASEITGEVSWTSPEGEVISFTYLADENGYQAQGSHVPQTPPIPPAIQRGLDLIRRANGLDF